MLTQWSLIVFYALPSLWLVAVIIAGCKFNL